MNDSNSSQNSKRYQTMPISKIDTEFLGQHICKSWTKANEDRDTMLSNREEYTSNWRDLSVQPSDGLWENSSKFKVPLTLTQGKALHARLWQLFSDHRNFFGVAARQEVFQEKVVGIKDFMTFLITHHMNNKQGIKDVQDESLWDNVFEGSSYLKAYWKKVVHQYVDVVKKVDIKEELSFNPKNLTGETKTEAIVREEDEVVTEIVETPCIGRINLEDIIMPVGEGDPQTAKWVAQRVWFEDDDLKQRAQDNKFDQDQVEEAIKHKTQMFSNSNEDNIKRARLEMDGYNDPSGYYVQDGTHAVLEWYGKIYITPEITEEIEDDIQKLPQEVVIWVHMASGLVLGWTYLYRVSPGGIRPIFKTDYIKFPDRGHGVGAAEVLAPIQQATDATYNLRQDNGVLASTQFGVYRPSSGLKPDKVRIEPATLLPVDDPQNDIRMMQFPFLAGFGYQEEDRLMGYAERLMSQGDIQIGRTPAKVGVFRTASGGNQLESASSIQLEIHFDRLARTWSKILQCLFKMARERIPSEFYYRITGEDGNPIFGKVNRDDLKGEYDFEINVDILGESRTEAEQKATMLMQMLINPAFMNTGVVSPSNLYHLAKNFLQKNRFKRVDNYITQPQQYTGEIVTPAERVFRIVVGQLNGLNDTVRLDDNHAKALEFYEGFKASDNFGLLTQPAQLEALASLEETHNQMLAAQQAGANPNMSGMQIPREGFPAMGNDPASQGALGAPLGEANGPVV